MTVEPELPDEILNEAREYTDTAVITICRFSGEGWDRKCEAAQDGYVMDGDEKKQADLSAKIFEDGDFCLTNAENVKQHRMDTFLTERKKETPSCQRRFLKTVISASQMQRMPW